MSLSMDSHVSSVPSSLRVISAVIHLCVLNTAKALHSSDKILTPFSLVYEAYYSMSLQIDRTKSLSELKTLPVGSSYRCHLCHRARQGCCSPGSHTSRKSWSSHLSAVTVELGTCLHSSIHRNNSLTNALAIF